MSLLCVFDTYLAQYRSTNFLVFWRTNLLNLNINSIHTYHTNKKYPRGDVVGFFLPIHLHSPLVMSSLMLFKSLIYLIMEKEKIAFSSTYYSEVYDKSHWAFFFYNLDYLIYWLTWGWLAFWFYPNQSDKSPGLMLNCYIYILNCWIVLYILFILPNKVSDIQNFHLFHIFFAFLSNTHISFANF